MSTTIQATTTTIINNVWRCAGEIWTAENYHLNIRRSAELCVNADEIEVVLPRHQIRFSSHDVIEARTFRWPVRSLTLIFSAGDQVGLVSLFRLRRRALEQFVAASGLSINDHRRWRTGLEAGRDKEKYCLHS